MKNLNLTPDQALIKIKAFCAYQERCHKEVKDKLYQFGLYGKDVDEIISTLISEDYLNEQRFAIAFAGGHFRMKSWGKVKIKYELRQKQVSDACINKALLEIDDSDYQGEIEKKARTKWDSLSSEKNKFTKKRKMLNYLMQKGFDSKLSLEAIANLERQNKDPDG